MLIPILCWCQASWEWIKHGWPDAYLPPLVALAAFAWSIWTFTAAKRRERFKLGIDLILKMSERFDSPEMQKHRAIAATALLTPTTEKNMSVNTVLDFFEEIGFLWHRGAIDLEAIDTYFSSWLLPYYGATTEYRKNEMESGVWSYFNAIGMRVERFENWRRSNLRWSWIHFFSWCISQKNKKSNRWDSEGKQKEINTTLEEERTKSVKVELPAHILYVARYGE